MSKNIISKGGNNPVQAITGTGKVQEVKAISAEKIEKILDYMEENDMPLRNLEEHLECMGVNDSPEIISQIKRSDKFILGSLKEKFLNHKTEKFAKEIIELTKTMSPEDALLNLDWGYDNSGNKISSIFQEAKVIPAKLIIEQAKNMEINEAIDLLCFGLRHSNFQIEKMFSEAIVNLTNKLEPKESIRFLSNAFYFRGESRNIIKNALMSHSNLLIESTKKLNQPKDILDTLRWLCNNAGIEDSIETFEESMIIPAKSFIENTKKMPQRGIWETLKNKDDNYIKNFFKISFDVITKNKRTKDILEDLEWGLYHTRGKASEIFANAIVEVLKEMKSKEALKFLKQKYHRFGTFISEIFANVIVDIVSKNTNQKEILKDLEWGFENGGWDDRKIFTKAIISLTKKLEPIEALKILYKGYNFSSDEIQDLFKEAMVAPSKSLIESTKNMPQKQALKILRGGRYNSAYSRKISELFDKEIGYRSNISKLNEIIQN
ncbi:hypothetical protein M0P65_02370 [Candidatus Gracilibacteria bacterium]|nr:hypothetical protein [Candidatus Gracilibacteria bacterium]